MENVKVAVTGQAKLGFRELNLKQGGNNVRWLNDREDRLLQTSLNSMEKAHKRTLNRLQHEVKGLHNTLREQATVRSPQIAKKAHHLTDKENSETKRPTMSLFTRTSDLKGESFSLSKTEEVVEEFETVDHISLEGELEGSCMHTGIHRIDKFAHLCLSSRITTARLIVIAYTNHNTTVLIVWLFRSLSEASR